MRPDAHVAVGTLAVRTQAIKLDRRASFASSHTWVSRLPETSNARTQTGIDWAPGILCVAEPAAHAAGMAAV